MFVLQSRNDRIATLTLAQRALDKRDTDGARMHAEKVGLPCRIADDPLTVVARGTGVFLDNLGEVQSILEQAEEH